MPLLALTALAFVPAALGQDLWCCTPATKLEGYNLRINNRKTHTRQDTVQDCQDRCTEYEGCLSIEYRPTDLMCHMNTVTLENADLDKVIDESEEEHPYEYCEPGDWCCTPELKIDGNNVRNSNDRQTHTKQDTIEGCQNRCDKFEECLSLEYNELDQASDGGINCHINTVLVADADPADILSGPVDALGELGIDTWEYCQRGE